MLAKALGNEDDEGDTEQPDEPVDDRQEVADDGSGDPPPEILALRGSTASIYRLNRN